MIRDELWSDKGINPKIALLKAMMQSAVIASATCPSATLSGLNGDRSLGATELVCQFAGQALSPVGY